MPATVIQAARASELCWSSGAPFTTHILSAMAATSHQLALQYLLELSSEIRLALFLDPERRVIAAAPSAPGSRLEELAGQLAAEAGARFGARGGARGDGGGRGGGAGVPVPTAGGRG